MPESKGHLNPGAPGVAFDRFELGPGLGDLVRHVWKARWRLPEGETSRQRVLTYPAFNAVFEPGRVALYPPDSRVSIRELRGASWGVGVLFRPAAGPLLTDTPPDRLPPTGEPTQGAPVRDVDAAMAAGDSREPLVRLLRRWLLPYAAGIDARGLLVNRACALAENDHELTRAADLAARLAVTPRTLERLIREYTGMTPKWLIECRRLQHAASTLFAQPSTDLSALAAELGYTDYPHFSRRYALVLGETPKETTRTAR